MQGNEFVYTQNKKFFSEKIFWPKVVNFWCFTQPYQWIFWGAGAERFLFFISFGNFCLTGRGILRPKFVLILVCGNSLVFTRILVVWCSGRYSYHKFLLDGWYKWYLSTDSFFHHFYFDDPFVDIYGTYTFTNYTTTYTESGALNCVSKNVH